MPDLLVKIAELQKLKMELQTMQDFLTAFSTQDERIQYGSRVQYERHDGTWGEGRVWRVKPGGDMAVNRDGYKAEIIINERYLKNLSIGTLGRTERLSWVTARKCEQLKREIESQAIDALDFQLNIAEGSYFQKIQLLSNEAVRDINARLITFSFPPSKSVRKVVTSSPFFRGVPVGLYNLEFQYGHLVSIRHARP